MTVEKAILDATYQAYTDLRSCQYAFMKLVSNNDVVTVTATSGERMIGILQDQPNSGMNAVVRLAGVSKLRGAGTVSANALVTTAMSGEGIGITLTSGQYVMAQAVDALADGKTSRVLLRGASVRAQ
jgi:hypothetical protein